MPITIYELIALYIINISMTVCVRVHVWEWMCMCVCVCVFMCMSLIIMMMMMEICKAPTPRLKRWTNITHIMYIEMENDTHNITKANT